MRDDRPAVSVVIPAKNETNYLRDTLDRIARLERGPPFEVIVVDGASKDDTGAIASDWGATLVAGTGRAIGTDRNLGAERASGNWLAFLDADTLVEPDWLDEMWRFIGDEALIAASSRCRMAGGRAKLMAWTINHVFSRLPKPILPGFNFWVDRQHFDAQGGFPAVPNEDTALSRRLAREGPTAYHPERLVTHSSRRIDRSGLTGTAYHYARLDAERLRRGWRDP